MIQPRKCCSTPGCDRLMRSRYESAYHPCS
nr:MAG TPA: hypothetical protein [Caudoviricetes sp.]